MRQKRLYKTAEEVLEEAAGRGKGAPVNWVDGMQDLGVDYRVLVQVEGSATGYEQPGTEQETASTAAGVPLGGETMHPDDELTKQPTVLADMYLKLQARFGTSR